MSAGEGSGSEVERVPPVNGDDERRSSSFGAEAGLYDRFRPAPPRDAVEFMLPAHVSVVVDVGAGTGALTRMLVERADRVIAVEPDPRMREVLENQVLGIQVVAGRGERMPVPDASIDAVLASSSWHWVDRDQGFAEVARVLAPGGTFGAVWTGPDLDSPFISQARLLLTATESDAVADLESTVFDRDTPDPVLAVPDGAPFSLPEHRTVAWDIALNADELIGLLGTFSWVLLMEDQRRKALVTEARRLLADGLGVAGDVTVDVGFKAEAWRSRFIG